MKEDIFNQYVDRVLNLFGITREELFSRSRKRNIVDARQLIYYLCFNRPIMLKYIEKFMSNNGHDVCHQTIKHGVNIVEQKIHSDRDYQSIIKDIEKAVFI